MKAEEHFFSLGKLWSNYHSLEFLLRAYILEKSGVGIGLPHGTDIYSFTAGKELPESPLTNYDSLANLIKKYNSYIEISDKTLALDISLIDIRDALAHGRVSTDEEHKPLRIIKFDKPKDGKVRIVFNQEMNKQWFDSETKHVFNAVGKVYTAIKKLRA
jgi:hypothetical protein